MDVANLAITLVLGAIAGAIIVIALQRMQRGASETAARRNADAIREQAEKDATARLQEAELEIKVRIDAAEARVEEESRQRAREVEEQRIEIERRDKDLRRRIAYADEKMEQVQQRQTDVEQQEKRAAALEEEAEKLLAQHRGRLEEIAGYSAREAKEELKREMEVEARQESASSLVRLQEETRERSVVEARWIITQAMQRMPLSQYAETTVTVVQLPGDDMKGRIIGREGRNIRAIETSTGIDLIIDDTPGVIILSSFDPKRRMIAKLAIEKLIEDGRIHPARIEEVIQKVKEDFDKTTVEQGEAAAFELGLADINPKLVKLAGRLSYLTYHGQNILAHSREVAVLASNLASMVGARGETVKRAGFLHKIGFADETNVDRSPLILSADIAMRHGEPETVVHAIQALYGIVAPRSMEAVLLQVAERTCNSRPGAQKEMLQEYLERLGGLEDIARQFKGVKNVCAVRAGKEIRVVVSAEEVTDKESVWLSRDIAKRIEKEVDYPGQLRVTVIRETRSVGYAM